MAVYLLHVVLFDRGITASIIKRPYGYQLRVTHKLLPKPLWATFEDYETAETYGKQLEGLLAQGIVPAALLEAPSAKNEVWTVHRCVVEYVRHNAVPLSDQRLLETLLPSVAKVATSMLNDEWAEAWIREFKQAQGRQGIWPCADHVRIAGL